VYAGEGRGVSLKKKKPEKQTNPKFPSIPKVCASFLPKSLKLKKWRMRLN
jgi:hypothetical protein